MKNEGKINISDMDRLQMSLAALENIENSIKIPITEPTIEQDYSNEESLPIVKEDLTSEIPLFKANEYEDDLIISEPNVEEVIIPEVESPVEEETVIEEPQELENTQKDIPMINTKLLSEKSLEDTQNIDTFKEETLKISPKSDNSNKNLRIVLSEIKKFTSKATTKELLNFTLECILLCVIILALLIPFNLLITLGSNVLLMLNIETTANTMNIYNVICYSIYTIIALYYYISEFKNRFYNINTKYHKTSK